MAKYRKHEAREWAKDNMKGVANTITPTNSGVLGVWEYDGAENSEFVTENHCS